MQPREYKFNNSKVSIIFGNILNSSADVIVSSDDTEVSMGVVSPGPYFGVEVSRFKLMRRGNCRQELAMLWSQQPVICAIKSMFFTAWPSGMVRLAQEMRRAMITPISSIVQRIMSNAWWEASRVQSRKWGKDYISILVQLKICRTEIFCSAYFWVC